jgi:hypothetical protein
LIELIHIDNVEPLEGRWLRVWFSNGAVKDVDMSEVIAEGPVFGAVREDEAVFAQVRVNHESGTVEWPGGVDLDPLVLYGSFEPASGRPLERRIVRPPAV